MTENNPAAICFIVVGFADPAQIRAGFDRLSALAAEGPMRIVDVEFVHSIHGMASTVPAARVDPGLSGLDEIDTHLLGQADLDVVADLMPIGSTAAVVLYAGAPVLPVLAEWTRAGATILGEGTAGQPGPGLLGGG